MQCNIQVTTWLYKASDTLESFLSKVAFKSDFRKQTF